MIIRWPWLIVLIALIAIICLGVPAIRSSMLRGAGWILVANDPVQSADVIVIAVDADGSGTLEASDLFHSGVARQVAVFADPPDYSVENEFIRRQVPYEGGAERSIKELTALGVGSAFIIPGYVEGTSDEGPALAAWCDKHQLRSVIVVTTPDHSRRLRRALHRAFEGHHTHVGVRASRYSMFDPDAWWVSHGGIRTELEELEKLALDSIRHPLWTKKGQICTVANCHIISANVQSIFSGASNSRDKYLISLLVQNWGVAV
jgi:hypothetical protein